MNSNERSNPFPAFAVEPDLFDLEDFNRKSVRTHARKELENFLTGYYSGEYENCIVGIRGDYGSGKTHLLRYAQLFFAKKNEEICRSATSNEAYETAISNEYCDNFCIFTNSTGTTFFEYFLRQLINQFEYDVIVDLMTRFLAKVAEQEAAKLSITKSAVEFLQKDYRAGKNLLQEDVLPTSRILDNLYKLVTEYGKNEEISRVFVAMLDPRFASAAYRWLTRGPKVEKKDLQVLAIKRRLDSDELALATLRVIARIFTIVGIRWAVLVDQFEHLMQSERVQKTEHIQNAFKDLSVAMSQGHCLIIAGHYSGWKVKEDFYGRFLSPIIEIPHLDVKEVRLLVSTYLNERIDQRSTALLNALKEYSRANIRTLLLICNKLYKRLSVNFKQAKKADVDASYEDIRYMREPDVIIDNLSSQLQSRGVLFELGAVVADIWQPTFVIPNRDTPYILIHVIRASKATDEIEKLRALVNRAAIVREKTGNPRVLFILTGYVSTELLKEIEKVRFEGLDATDRSFDRLLAEFVDGLEANLSAKAGLPETKSTAINEKEIRQILDRMKEIESQRKAERDELEERLAQLSKETQYLHEDLKMAQAPKASKQDYQVSIEAILPERFPRLKYIGGLPKVGFIILSCFLLVSSLGMSGTISYDLIYSFIPLHPRLIFYISLPLFICFSFLLYMDWNLVDMVHDRLMSMRRRDLLAKRDIYIIHKREEEIHWMLRNASLFITSVRRYTVLNMLRKMEYEMEKNDGVLKAK